MCCGTSVWVSVAMPVSSVSQELISLSTCSSMACEYKEREEIEHPSKTNGFTGALARNSLQHLLQTVSVDPLYILLLHLHVSYRGVNVFSCLPEHDMTFNKALRTTVLAAAVKSF